MPRQFHDLSELTADERAARDAIRASKARDAAALAGVSHRLRLYAVTGVLALVLVLTLLAVL